MGVFHNLYFTALVLLSVLMDSVYLHTNNKRNKIRPWDEGLRHNWRNDKK